MWLAVKIISFTRRHCRRILNPTGDLLRYKRDKESWAVVTGGSDGIGFQLCRQLATQGFNICIIGRDSDKIKRCIAEIHKEVKVRPQVTLCALIVDFAKLTSIQEYEVALAPMKMIPIDILCLNAGVADVGVFSRLEHHVCQRMLAVNALHVTYMMKVLLPQLTNRTSGKSAILVTGSLLRGFEMPGMLMYSASKNFISYLARGVSYELADRVDVTVYEPCIVKTKMKGLLEIPAFAANYNDVTSLTAG